MPGSSSIRSEFSFHSPLIQTVWSRFGGLLGLALCHCVIACLLTACGHRTSPRPVSISVPAPIELVGAYAFPKRIVLRWGVPRLNADGSPLKNLSGFKVYRISAPLDEDCEDCAKRILHSYVDFQNPASAKIVNGVVVYKDNRVETGHIYIYEIAAQNIAGRESELSQPVEVVFKEPPPAPVGVIAIGGESEVRLEWDSPERPSGIRGYRIYRGKADDPWEMELTGQTRWAENLYTDTDVRQGATYYYSVRSYKMVKGIPLQSAASDAVFARVSGRAVSAPPQPHAVNHEQGITVFWRPVKEPGHEIRYNIYRAEAGQGFERINSTPVDKPNFEDSNLKKGVRYRYRVTAFPKGEPGSESRYSAWISIRRKE